MGGTIAKLYASEYPQDVSGLVLVDATFLEARTVLTDEQWETWKGLLGKPPSKEKLDLYPALEWFDIQQNMKQALAAAPLKPMPLIVLQSDKPYDLTPQVKDGTLSMTAAQAEQFGKSLYQSRQDAMADLVGQVPGAKLITKTHSGHYIHQEHPKLL